MELMTNEIAALLHKRDLELQASRRGTFTNTGTAVKYFCPWGAASWFIYSGTPLDSAGRPTEPAQATDWHLWGRCDLYGDGGELGYVLLSQLEGIEGPVGMKIERDLHLDADYLPKQDEGLRTDA